jgi:hypothetical protein
MTTTRSRKTHRLPDGWTLYWTVVTDWTMSGKVHSTALIDGVKRRRGPKGQEVEHLDNPELRALLRQLGLN